MTTSVSKVKFSNCDTIREVVHCKDVASLLQFVLSAPNVSDQPLVKIGIDGGGDFLKMSLGVLETTPEPTSPDLKSPMQLFLQRLWSKTTAFNCHL